MSRNLSAIAVVLVAARDSFRKRLPDPITNHSIDRDVVQSKNEHGLGGKKRSQQHLVD